MGSQGQRHEDVCVEGWRYEYGRVVSEEVKAQASLVHLHSGCWCGDWRNRRRWRRSWCREQIGDTGWDRVGPAGVAGVRVDDGLRRGGGRAAQCDGDAEERDRKECPGPSRGPPLHQSGGLAAPAISQGLPSNSSVARAIASTPAFIDVSASILKRGE